MDFHDDAGLPLSRRELDAIDDVFFCDRHVEASPGAFCPDCADGLCEECGEEIPLGAAAAGDLTLVWCRRCVDNDIRSPQPQGSRGVVGAARGNGICLDNNETPRR